MATVSVSLTPYPNSRSIMRVAPYGAILGPVARDERRHVEETDSIEIGEDDGLAILAGYLVEPEMIDVAYAAGDEVRTTVDIRYFLRDFRR